MRLGTQIFEPDQDNLHAEDILTAQVLGEVLARLTHQASVDGLVQVVLDAFESVSAALASSRLPWLGGPSFHPEAFSPVMCALAAVAALRWRASDPVAELVKSRLPAVARSVPLESLHSSLARYFDTLAADLPPPAALY